MNYKKYIVVSIISSFTLLLILLKPASKHSNNINHSDENIYESINLFSAIIYEIKKSYYKDISINTLISYAIEGMIEKLDPYSTYLKKEDFETINNYTEGEFFGIGIQFFKNKNNLIEVFNVVDNSPAKKVGILTGDILVSINSKQASNLGINEVSQLLKEKNDNIKIELAHVNNITYTITLNKEKFTLSPLTYKRFDNILYIKIPSFNKKTYLEINNIVKKNQYNMKGLILDLRGNGGGLLDPAVKISDLFLDNKMIIKLENSNKKHTELFISTNGDIINNKSIVILIDDATASASEVLAGSLQENKRAIIVGTKSFGKGVVQDIMKIDNGDYIKLTTSEYILPSNKKVDNNGITPNITIFKNGYICNGCSKNKISEMQEKEVDFILTNKNNQDYQLNKALELIKKR